MTRSRRTLILAIGIGQIISWGMLTYAIAVLGTPMGADLGFPTSVVFGAFSFSLIVSGVVAPATGRLVDRSGGRTVLLVGALLTGLGFGILAVASSLPSFFVGWGILGVAMSMSLYEAAFATLSQHIVQNLRKAITAVTLFGGFASTIFIPVCLYGLEHFGWRTTIAAFCGLQLLVNIPLYAMGLPGGNGAHARADEAARTIADGASKDRGPRTIQLLGFAFAAAAFVTSAVSAHVVNILHGKGLSLDNAVWVAALIGPTQVAGRIIEISFGRHISIIRAATAALLLLFVAMMLLTQVDTRVALACVFVSLYGVANGVVTIARGAVPAHLFGRTGYGATIGQIARPSFIARALAPVALSFTLGIGGSFSLAEWALLAAAAAALLLFLVAIKLSPPQSQPSS